MKQLRFLALCLGAMVMMGITSCNSCCSNNSTPAEQAATETVADTTKACCSGEQKCDGNCQCGDECNKECNKECGKECAGKCEGTKAADGKTITTTAVKSEQKAEVAK